MTDALETNILNIIRNDTRRNFVVLRGNYTDEEIFHFFEYMKKYNVCSEDDAVVRMTRENFHGLNPKNYYDISFVRELYIGILEMEQKIDELTKQLENATMKDYQLSGPKQNYPVYDIDPQINQNNDQKISSKQHGKKPITHTKVVNPPKKIHTSDLLSDNSEPSYEIPKQHAKKQDPEIYDIDIESDFYDLKKSKRKSHSDDLSSDDTNSENTDDESEEQTSSIDTECKNIINNLEDIDDSESLDESDEDDETNNSDENMESGSDEDSDFTEESSDESSEDTPIKTPIKKTKVSFQSPIDNSKKNVKKITKPEPVKKITKPEPVKKITKPEPVKKVTKPEPVKKVTKPEPVKKVTKPEPVKKVTKPEPVKKVTKPESVKKITKPEPVKKATKSEPVKNPPPKSGSKTTKKDDPKKPKKK